MILNLKVNHIKNNNFELVKKIYQQFHGINVHMNQKWLLLVVIIQKNKKINC